MLCITIMDNFASDSYIPDNTNNLLRVVRIDAIKTTCAYVVNSNKARLHVYMYMQLYF